MLFLNSMRRTADRMVRAVYLHFCMLLMEIIHIPRKLHPTNWRQRSRSQGRRQACGGSASGAAVAPRDRPFRQLGNGRLCPRPARFTTHAIAQPTRQSVSRRFSTQLPQHARAKGVGQKRRFRPDADPARQRRRDCDPGGSGCRPRRGNSSISSTGPASTHKAVALLALEFDVPMIVIGTPKVPGDMR